MALTSKQRGVIRGASAAAVSTVLAVSATLIWQPAFLTPHDDLESRLLFALKADLGVLILLVVAIGRMAQHRFFTPGDIDGGGLSEGTQRARELQAILQNTLEQSVLAIGVHIIWAVVAPAAWASVIPVAVTLFVLGRVLFFAGYGSGAPGRAMGFGLTFYPSVLLLALLLILALGPGG